MGVGGSNASNDVLLVGLKGAGKTHLLYNCINEEGWQQTYLKETDNVRRQMDNNFLPKNVCLLPTLGFNNEKVQTESLDFNCWDVGGTLFYGGEMAGEYFSTGADSGLNLYLRNNQYDGVLYVVDINTDPEWLIQAKNVWLDFVYSSHQLKTSQFLLVFNQKKELVKKTTGLERSGMPIFQLQDIKKIHTNYRECFYTKEQLDGYFKIEDIQARLTRFNQYGEIISMMGDVNDKAFAKEVMNKIAKRIKEAEKQEKKDEKKAQQLAEKKAAEDAKKNKK